MPKKKKKFEIFFFYETGKKKKCHALFWTDTTQVSAHSSLVLFSAPFSKCCLTSSSMEVVSVVREFMRLMAGFI